MIRERLGRLGYRIAYVALVAGSRIVRPHTRGVKCLLVAEGQVLLIRHSYGPGTWDLPGGFCKRREAFLDAARREVNEELGVEQATFVDLGEMRRRFHGRHETLHGFRVTVARADAVPRSLEVAEARWFARDALPEEPAAIVGEVLALDAGLPTEHRG